MRRAPLLAVVAIALLVAPVLSGCGGKSKSSQQQSASSWAEGFCKAFVTWRDNIKSSTSKVTSGQIGKGTIKDAASAISDANNKLADDLEALGKPSTPNADEAKTAVDQLAKTLRDSSTEIKDAAKGISSAQDVGTAATKIGTTLSNMAGDLSAATGKLRDLGNQDTWKKAFADSASCKKLANGG